MGYVDLKYSSAETRVLRVNYTETLNIDANTSTVTISSVQLKNTFTGTVFFDGIISLNGTQVVKMSVSQGTGYCILSSTGTFTNCTIPSAVSVTIPHNTDGTATLTWSFTHNTYSAGFEVYAYSYPANTYYFQESTISVAATTVPRASSISCAGITLGSSGTATITKASSAFTSTVSVVVGSTTVETLATKTSATSVTFSPTLANYGSRFAAASKTLTVTLNCDTYNGNTLIGTKTANVTLTMPENSSTKPTISSITISETVTGGLGVYVQTKSKPRIVTSATGKYNATIASVSISFDGQTLSGADVTAAALNNSGTITATVTVKDSRGFSVSGTASITAYAYSSPTITSFRVIRCNSSGVADDSGTYCKVTGTITISAVNNLNTKTFAVKSKTSSATSWASVDSGTLSAYSVSFSEIYSGYSTDSGYDIRLSVTDHYGAIDATGNIETESAIMSFHSSGTGIAFGKVAEKSNMFECNLPVSGAIASLEGNNAEIPSGSDINDYIEIGTYAVKNNDIANNLKTNGHLPSYMAGALIVKAGMNTVVATTLGGCYRLQIYLPYDGTAIYMRCMSKSTAAGSWNIGSWYKFTGTAI